VRLVFIHHSCGENWLVDAHGGLGKALAENNYFVSDTNYGWGPNAIGDRTDITNWPEWFVGAQSAEYLQALYRENGQNCTYARTLADPGGENEVILFKSCFPNSNLEGNPDDAPKRGEGLTVANAKAIYQELLAYFATRPDKLFIVITAPPVQDPACAANARALNRWLVENWLADYQGHNVGVFDFHNVLTAPDNHHRVRAGRIEYLVNAGNGTLHYPSDGDDHPSPAGNRKATEEFVPLLNLYYQRWMAAPRGAAPVSAQRAETERPVAKSEPPATAQPVPSAAPVATVTAAGLIDDFEKELRSWTTFLDPEKETRLSFRRDTELKHEGTAALRIQYDVAPGSWALCSLVHERPQDWSRFRGVRLSLHADQANQTVDVVVYGGRSADELQHFERALPVDRTAVDGWQQVDILWPQLKLPDWQGDTAAKFDPRSAMGVAIAITSSGERRAGEMWLDDVALLSDEGAPRK
jgi:hypothetical protein